jgi:hypothetical protein
MVDLETANANNVVFQQLLLQHDRTVREAEHDQQRQQLPASIVELVTLMRKLNTDMDDECVDVVDADSSQRRVGEMLAALTKCEREIERRLVDAKRENAPVDEDHDDDMQTN